MNDRTTWMLALVCLRVLLLPPCEAQQPLPPSKSEVARAIVADHVDCKAKEIYFDKLLYHDFAGDGYKDAIAVARTCDTGTAGPDVHSVFSRDASGKVVQRRLPEPPPGTYDVLVGWSNSDLRIEKGLLVQDFKDGSYRKSPLTIRYEWQDAQFVIASIKKSRRFPTSFDCARASKDVEKAVCYIEPLAQLDLQVATAYRQRLRHSSRDEAEILRKQQQQWLGARDAVAIYWGFTNQLQDLYQKRLAELKHP